MGEKTYYILLGRNEITGFNHMNAYQETHEDKTVKNKLNVDCLYLTRMRNTTHFVYAEYGSHL
jgi:hypothetical protein